MANVEKTISGSFSTTGVSTDAIIVKADGPHIGTIYVRGGTGTVKLEAKHSDDLSFTQDDTEISPGQIKTFEINGPATAQLNCTAFTAGPIAYRMVIRPRT